MPREWRPRHWGIAASPSAPRNVRKKRMLRAKRGNDVSLADIPQLRISRAEGVAISQRNVLRASLGSATRRVYGSSFRSAA